MKTITISVLFPGNWYHYRNIKISDENGKLLGKVKHAEETIINVPDNASTLIFRLDFFKSKIQLNNTNSTEYILLYLGIRNSLWMYIDVLKSSALRAISFESKEEVDTYVNTLYPHFGKSSTINLGNKTNILLGIIISIMLLVGSFFDKSSGSSDLVLFIGITSLVSLILLFFENKLTLNSYKTRMFATLLAFVLSMFFMDSMMLVWVTGLLAFILFIRMIGEFKQLD